MHRLDRMHGVVTMSSWRLEIEFFTKLVQKVLSRLLPNSHRAIALDVAVAAHRTKTSARLAQLSTQHHQVNDLLNVRDRVLVLSQAHRPTENHAFRINKELRCIFDLRFSDSRLFENVTEVHTCESISEFREPSRVLVDELLIENFTRAPLFGIEYLFHDALEQSHVTVDAHLQKQIGELCPAAEPIPEFLRMFETRRANFRQRIDVHDLAAASLRLKQSRQHAWMIRAGILADDENRIAELEIFQRHCTLAKAERFFHSGAARFMAHVRTVRQIVRAELPHEQLIKKRGFVAGAP